MRIFIPLLLGGYLAAAAAEPQRFEAAEPHMGTLFRIVLYADDPSSAQEAARAALDRIAELDSALSDYKPDSELNRVCGRAWREPVRVSDDLWRVLDASQRLAEESSGAFDVTLGPVTRLWRQARRDRHPPDPWALAEARALTGYRKLTLDPGFQSVSLQQRGMLLDLGGIAKGYAADEALRVLRERGFPRALVAASGDIAIGDAPPGKAGWTIGLEPAPGQGFARVVTLVNAAVSTSGDAEQHLTVSGKRYSHIINPRTGVGLTEPIAVSVIAKRGLEADGLATAVSVLGVRRGMRLVESRGARAIAVVGKRVLESDPPPGK